MAAYLAGLFLRGGSYYLRIVLPNDHPLKDSYRNGRLVRTLGKCTYLEAVRIGTVKRAEILYGYRARDSAFEYGPITPNCDAANRRPKLTVEVIYQRWLAAKTRTRDSEAACLRAVALFNQCFSSIDIKVLTRSQGDKFRAWLLSQNTTSKTTRDRFNWIKTLLNYAARDLELIPKNPWAGLEIDHKTEAKRRPWGKDELQNLFSQPLFTNYELPKDKKAGLDAAYWIPILGLHTGARISELAQLRIADVIQLGKVPAINITNEGTEQQVKSTAGLRQIPIHPELLRLGFLQYVEATKASGNTMLWPGIKLRQGRPGGFFSAWFSSFRKTIGLTDKYPDFHCFRHTVRTEMSRAGVNVKVQDNITGHETHGSVGTKVYQTVNELELLEGITALSFVFLKLRKVYKKPVNHGKQYVDKKM